MTKEEALQEPREDCISRQDAVVEVTNALWHYPNQLYKNLNKYEVAWGVVSDALRNLPSVTPTERTGEWEEVEKSEHGGLSIVSMRCNQCVRWAYLVLPKGTKCVYDYCPNCGAKMKGGADE